jgi:hypothetical protein
LREAPFVVAVDDERRNDLAETRRLRQTGVIGEPQIAPEEKQRTSAALQPLSVPSSSRACRKGVLRQAQDDNRQAQDDNRQAQDDNRQAQDDNRQAQDDNRQAQDDRGGRIPAKR